MRLASTAYKQQFSTSIWKVLYCLRHGPRTSATHQRRRFVQAGNASAGKRSERIGVNCGGTSRQRDQPKDQSEHVRCGKHGADPEQEFQNCCRLEAQVGSLLRATPSYIQMVPCRFPGLQDSMKALLATEMDKVIREEKFLKEEPERLESALRRCKKLTGTLVTLKR